MVTKVDERLVSRRMEMVLLDSSPRDRARMELTSE